MTILQMNQAFPQFQLQSTGYSIRALRAGYAHGKRLPSDAGTDPSSSSLEGLTRLGELMLAATK